VGSLMGTRIDEPAYPREGPGRNAPNLIQLALFEITLDPV